MESYVYIQLYGWMSEESSSVRWLVKKTKKAETDPQTQRTSWWLPEARGVGGMGKMGEGQQQVRSSSYGMNSSRGQKTEHREESMALE